MSLLTFIRDKTNRIKTGSAAAVGLILTSGALGSALLWGQNLAGVNTATLDPNGNLTLSGELLTKSGSKAAVMRGNGDMMAQGTISGNHLYAGSMSGAGLEDCDAASQTLNWDATTGRFTCGTDATGAGGGTDWSNTGSILTAADSKYVNIGGDTMTGALAVRSTLSGSGLFTLSGYRTCTLKTTSTGQTVCGMDNDTSQNLFETIAVSGQSNIIADSTTDTLTLAEGSNITITTTAGTDTLTIAATDTNTTYTAAKGLTLIGTAFALNDTITGSSLKVSGTLSGALLVLSNMRSCDLKTSSTGNVLCGTDLNSDLFNTGSILSQTEGKYVNVGGDTMTGALTVDLAAGFLGLRIIETASGARIHAEQGLSSSGTLVWEGAGSGASLWVSKLDGAGLVDCDLTTNKLLWDATLDRFSCGTDIDTQWSGTGAVLDAADRKYVNLGGDTMTGTLAIAVTGGVGSTIGLRVINTASGATFHAEKTLSSSGGIVWERAATGNTLWSSIIRAGQSLNSSGSLTWEGAASGATLWVSKLDGAGLTDCDLTTNKLLWDTTLDRFSCGTDLNSDLISTGALLGAADRKYVNLGGDTMTGTLNIDLSSGFRGLNVKQTLSGSIIHAERGLTSSGAVVWETSASGGILYISRNSTFSSDQITLSASGASVFNVGLQDADFRINGTTTGLFYLDASTNRIGINKTDPRTTLDVNGTISGSTIEANTLSGIVIRSQYAISPTCIPFILFGTGTAMTTGSGKVRMQLPYTMSGARLGLIKIFSDYSGVGGTASIQIRNTVPSIDTSESGSTTAATPYVINTANNDISLDDIVYMDVVSIHSTRAAKGLSGYSCWYRP